MFADPHQKSGRQNIQRRRRDACFEIVRHSRTRARSRLRHIPDGLVRRRGRQEDRKRSDNHQHDDVAGKDPKLEARQRNGQLVDHQMGRPRRVVQLQVQDQHQWINSAR